MKGDKLTNQSQPRFSACAVSQGTDSIPALLHFNFKSCAKQRSKCKPQGPSRPKPCSLQSDPPGQALVATQDPPDQHLKTQMVEAAPQISGPRVQLANNCSSSTTFTVIFLSIYKAPGQIEDKATKILLCVLYVTHKSRETELTHRYSHTALACLWFTGVAINIEISIM